MQTKPYAIKLLRNKDIPDSSQKKRYITFKVRVRQRSDFSREMNAKKIIVYLQHAERK